MDRDAAARDPRDERACRRSTSSVEFAAGEELRTEISAKFRREGIEAELAAAGFEPTDWWTDTDDRFALSLARAVD